MVCRYAFGAGALEGEGRGVVADDNTDFGVETAALTGVNDCLKVGPAVRCEDA